MKMQAAAVQREDANVFYYGFLSSRISGVLHQYSDTEELTPDTRRTLEEAYQLLTEITTAQTLFAAGKEAAVPSEHELDAFGCALEVILANRAAFGVRDVAELGNLFRTLYDTLHKILEGDQRPAPDLVKKTRLFFKHLAARMLAQLSIPEEPEFSVV